MTAISATKARANLFAILRRATRGHEPLRISYRDRTAILLSEDEFESLVETAALLSTTDFRASLRRAEADIRAGRLYTIERVFGPRTARSRRGRVAKRRSARA